ncbi:hypothetical protein KIW84_076463, partial [Lathyrus oleraceus]
ATIATGGVGAQLNPILQNIDHRWFCQRSFIVHTEIAEFFFVDTTPFVDKYFLKPKDHKYDLERCTSKEEVFIKPLEGFGNSIKGFYCQVEDCCGTSSCTKHRAPWRHQRALNTPPTNP